MALRFMLKHRREALLCIFAIAWTFLTVSATPAATADRLQALLNDTAVQIQLAYRQHPDERKLRQDQLAAVVTGWRAAARSETNNEQLRAWLHEAIRSSMPGSHEPLPAAPKFAASAKVESRVVESAGATNAKVDSGTKADADPFRDDPAEERN